MELQKRIDKAKPYFQLFNISENVAYSLMKMPSGWTVPSDLSKVYGVQVKKDTASQYGVYFFVDLLENTNGITAIFDAIDYTIEFNMTIEERTNIFKEKAELLKNLIYSEPIDKLKTLEFTFKKRPKKAKQIEKVVTEKEVIEEAPVAEKKIEEEPPITKVETVAPVKTKKKSKTAQNKNNNEDISMMDLAKSLIQ